MRPIRLKFYGLQSYREEQDIDFAELGSLGIFGVFGATGSGKSTILDAITLALFGKVERAKSGTRGILNQFEDRLLVSFEFSLGEDSYLAERLYAREKHDPDAVRNKSSRLIKLSADNQVLADKSGEMDNKVAQLLGMSFDDFSRAVILPQGKFDQFLKLTGGDRARMLENILRLERYGENLWKKASYLEHSLNQEILTDQKLLAQLGDASAETVHQAEEKLIQQGELVLRKEQAKKTSEMALKELEQLEVLHKEFASLQQQKDQLDAQKAALEKDRALLERAMQAEPLRGLLNQAAELTASQKNEEFMVTQQQTVCQQTELKVKQAEEGLARAKLSEAKLQNLREQVLPQVVLALDYEKQLLSLQQELQNIKESLKNKQLELKEVTTEGKEKGTLQDQAKAEREKLLPRKQELTQVLVYRPQVERALTVLVDLETAEQQMEEAEHALASRQKVQTDEHDKLKAILAEYLDSDAMARYGDNLTQLDEIVPVVVQQARDSLNQAQEFYDTLVMKNMAWTLAGKLTSSEPCPVCGATTHPHPAEGSAEDTEAINQAREQIKIAREQQDKVMTWERKAGLVNNTLRTIKEEINTVHQVNLVRKKDALAAALDKWQQEIAKFEETAAVVRSHTGLPNPDRNNLKSYKDALDKADLEFKQLEQKLGAREKDLQILEPEVTKLRETYLGIKHDTENLQNNLTAAGVKITQLQATLAEITGGLTAQEFQQNTVCQVSLMEKQITESQTAVEAARTENQEAEKMIAGLKAGLAKTSEHLNNVRNSLEVTMKTQGFAGPNEVREALLNEGEREGIKKRLDDFVKARDFVIQTLREVSEKIKDKPFNQEQINGIRQALVNLQQEYEEAVREQGALKKNLNDLRARQAEWQRLQVEINRLSERRELAAKLVSLLKGRKLVQFLAEEHLRDMAAEASIRLAGLTAQRYALELDEGCNFVMRDDYNGGQRRPVNTLSGGETFLTSLSLALALSSKIQLKGQYPLGFFFLDEGFGTLDPEKLETVVNTLERLHDGQRVVGIITHVPELRNRMPRYLEISAAGMDGTGSSVIMKKS